MTRARRAVRADGIIRWLLPASVFHVAAVLLAAALSPGAAPAPDGPAKPLSELEPESTHELTLLDEGQGSQASGAAPARANPFEAATPAASGAERVPPADVSRLPGARAAPVPRGSASLQVASSATPSLPGTDDPPASAPVREPSRSAAPTLSIDQLGIGTNPFLDIRVDPLTKDELASARLHAALHPPSLEGDRQGTPAGRVAGAARSLVLADDGLVEASAVLNVRVDSAGHVTEVDVLEASSQIKAWQLIAARLAKALGAATLRRPESKQGWEMKLRVASRVQLPSGAAPGTRIGVLGQQVAGSGGPGSTSLELSPTSKLDIKEPIDSVGRHLDQPIQFEVMLLKFRADPADIGATARRVVEVAVLSIDAPAAH